MKKNKKTAFLAGTMIAVMLLGGCGKKEETEATTATDAVINISPVATMDGSAEDITVISRDGYILSDLTGEWIDEKYANQRPLCIMINNLGEALPQSDISKAAITYEILVEGGITRLCCIFDTYDDINKLGSIRSARVPYVQLSEMYDAFYGHFGYSPTAQSMIENNPEILSLNGLFLEGTMYYRDSSRNAPHNVYTNSEMIAAGIEKMGYDYKHDDSYLKTFSFNYNDTDLTNGNPQPANKVTTTFSNYSSSNFTYNSDDKRYYREEYGNPHIDAETGEQTSYKNVIVMMVEYTTDETGYYRFIEWNKSHEIYYFTNGQYVRGYWDGNTGVTKIYYEDGTEIKLNPGNTFVTVFPFDIQEGLVIE